MTTIDAFAGLRLSFVRAFALARFMSISGQIITSVAVGWHLYERTGSPWALGLVGVVELTPVFLLMVVTGNVIDRYPRRNVAMTAHFVLACASTGLAAIAWMNG